MRAGHHFDLHQISRKTIEETNEWYVFYFIEC